jgi:hypothetical protein
VLIGPRDGGRETEDSVLGPATDTRAPTSTRGRIFFMDKLVRKEGRDRDVSTFFRVLAGLRVLVGGEEWAAKRAFGRRNVVCELETH